MAKVDQAQVLGLVNDIRKVFGRRALAKLPKGVVNDATSCPVARGIDVDGIEVYEFGLGVDDGKLVDRIERKRPGALGDLLEPDDPRNPVKIRGVYLYKSKVVTAFVKAFDAGKTPELVAG